VVVVEPGIVVVDSSAHAPFMQTQPGHTLAQVTDSNIHVP